LKDKGKKKAVGLKKIQQKPSMHFDIFFSLS